jgi:hypothetical protein
MTNPEAQGTCPVCSGDILEQDGYSCCDGHWLPDATKELLLQIEPPCGWRKPCACFAF